MATTVFRSVKIVVQNSTNEMLTVQGVATLLGEWAPKMEPVQGDQISEQSAIEWKSQSVTLGFGTEAFVRMSSSTGYITLRWRLPWTGAAVVEVIEHVGERPHIRLDDTHPDHLVAMVIIGGGGD